MFVSLNFLHVIYVSAALVVECVNWNVYLSVLQGSFAGLLLESVCETEAVFQWSSISQLLHSAPQSQLSLHCEEWSGKQVLAHTVLMHTQDRVVVPGLSPGHVYYFSLHLTHPSGASQTLGPIFITKTSESPCTTMDIHMQKHIHAKSMFLM